MCHLWRVTDTSKIDIAPLNHVAICPLLVSGVICGGGNSVCNCARRDPGICPCQRIATPLYPFPRYLIFNHIVNFIYTCTKREYLFTVWLFVNLCDIYILDDVSSLTNLPIETFSTTFPKLKAGCQLKTQFRLLLQKHVVRLVDSVRLHPRSVHHTHFKLNLGKYIRVCFEDKFQIWQNLVIDLVYPFPFWRCKTYLWWHQTLWRTKCLLLREKNGNTADK